MSEILFGIPSKIPDTIREKKDWNLALKSSKGHWDECVQVQRNILKGYKAPTAYLVSFVEVLKWYQVVENIYG